MTHRKNIPGSKGKLTLATLAILGLIATMPAVAADAAPNPEIEALKAELAAQRQLIEQLLAKQNNTQSAAVQAAPASLGANATPPAPPTPAAATAAVAAAAPGAVAAPGSLSIKVYGVLDVAAVRGNSGYGNKVRFDGGGGMSASRLGFRVDKQLTDTLKAVGQLEGGLLVDTGTIGAQSPGFGVNASAASSGSGTPGTGTQLFSRQAFAGMAGNFGQVTIGRQYTGSYIASAVIGSAYAEGTYAIAPNVTPNIGGMPARVSNSIVWATPKYHNFWSMLSYTTGTENNVSGSAANTSTTTTTSRAGQGYDLAALYDDGHLNVGVTTWSVANNSWVTAGETGLAQKRGVQVSANYNFGFVKLAGSYVSGTIKGGNYENVTKTLSNADAWSTSILVPYGPHNFLLAYTALDDKSLLDRSMHVIGASYWYKFDPQTSLYVSVGKEFNNGNASYTLIDSGNLVGNVRAAGYQPTSEMVGVNIRF